jgi:hypothetical protein
MLAAIFSILTAIFGFLGSSSDDTANIAAGDVGEDGFLTTLANNASGLFGAIGTGLALDEIDLDDAVLEFSLAKEAGLYHSIGIGDEGATQAVSEGLTGLIKQKWFFPAVFGIGAIFLLKKK